VSNEKVLLASLITVLACGDAPSDPVDDESGGTTDTTDESESGDDGAPPRVELSDPACMPLCVQDTNPVTVDVLDPNCVIIRWVPFDGGVTETNVTECPDTGLPDDGDDLCYVPVFGDELDPGCVDLGANLEFRFVRREGVPAPDGETLEAQCQLSNQPAVDCPDL
jgi:hypothetical protein